MKLRIWSEFLCPQDVMQDYVLEIFKTYQIHLHYKLEYMKMDNDFFEMIKEYNKRNIKISIWATLSEKQGYWINERNVAIFERYVIKLVDEIEKHDCHIDGVCIDMKPPIKQVNAIKRPKRFFQPYLAYIGMATINVNTRRYLESVRKFHMLQKFLNNKGIESFSYFSRQLYYDIKFNTNILQNALETPVFSIKWDKYNIPYYAAIIRNEMKSRNDAEIDYKIFHELLFLKQRFGEHLCASIIVSSRENSENEAHFLNDFSFTRDVGIVKATGVDDITLYSLDSIIKKAELEKYIKLIFNAIPIIPEVQNSIVLNESRFRRFIRFAKGYYSLYKI